MIEYNKDFRAYAIDLGNGRMVVPAGCENSFVSYCSVSIPFA